jgi:hypothetical protein
MVTKRIPGELADQTVVLMKILSIVRKNEIGGKLPLDLFKVFLDITTNYWEKTVPEAFNRHPTGLNSFEKCFSAG